MTTNDFLYNLTEEYGTAEFIYNGKNCGVEPVTTDSITTYFMWYGDKEGEYSDIDELMSADFFDGNSLITLLSEVDVQF